MTQRVTRVYADAAGESHFETVELPLKDSGDIGFLSDQLSATGVIFRWNPPDYDFDWHVAPARQFIILVDGNIEIETSDGKRRAFQGGDILLVEDTTGKGHRTRTTDAHSRRSVFITLGD